MHEGQRKNEYVHTVVQMSVCNYHQWDMCFLLERVLSNQLEHLNFFTQVLVT